MNEVIRYRIWEAMADEKIVQHRLRWFGHIQQRPPEAPVDGGIIRSMENTRRGRGRPKLTWEEVIKRDLSDWNVPTDLALDRTSWKSTIDVPES